MTSSELAGTAPPALRRIVCWAATALLGCTFAAACGSAPKRSASSEPNARREVRAAPRSGATPPALHASELARVPNVTFGPYLGTRPDGGLVVWAAAADGKGRRFSVVPLSASGHPLAPARTVADAPDRIGVVAVRALGEGYAVVYTRQAASGESLEALCLNARGEPMGAPSVIGSVSGQALWVEGVPQSNGALIVHAARQPNSHVAELGAVPLDARCHSGDRVELGRAALAWQATPLGRGALLAIVQPGEGKLGTVSALLLEPTGKPRATVSVSAQPGADLDLDAVSFGRRALLAWTDRQALDAHVLSAVIDDSGQLVRAPERLTPAEGEQALVRLVPPAPKGRAFVGWERISESATARRWISLSAVDEDGKLSGPRVELEYASDDEGVPELVPAANALAALTLAPACLKGKTCDTSDLAPTYVRFDDQLRPIAVEPLRLEPLGGARAELGFALGCARGGCFAIAALARTPAPVFAAELEARSTAWQAPLRPAEPASKPRVVEQESVSAADSISAFSVEDVTGSELLAYVTDFDPTTPWRRLTKPAPDGRYEPLRARVAVERLLPSGPRSNEPLSASPVSLRAHSLGGVATAPGDPSRGEWLVAWSGVDSGSPQLFVTLLGKNGERVAQRMLTHKKGDLYDIAAQWVGDGFIVAWVDERAGAPAIFAIKLDPKLRPLSPEQRITTGTGAAADLSLAFDGKGVELVWSDARSSDASGHADIFGARLRARDAGREGSEVRLAATRAHSFAPAVRAFGEGFAVAWLERSEDGEPGTLALSTLDAGGKAAPLAPVAIAGAEPRAVGLSCERSSCRIAVVADRKEGLELYGASWAGTGSPVPVRWLSLASGAPAVAPVLLGDHVFFVDGSTDGARIRRAKIEW